MSGLLTPAQAYRRRRCRRPRAHRVVGGAVHLRRPLRSDSADHTGILGVGKTLTYASHRLLTSGEALAREFQRSDISASIR